LKSISPRRGSAGAFAPAGWASLVLLLCALAALPLSAQPRPQAPRDDAGPAGPASSGTRPIAAPAQRTDEHEDSPVVTAVRREAEITVDGKLDEAGWQRATASGGYFTQIDPSEGEASPERTEVFVLFDDDAIYIGARLHDSSGDVRKRLGRRDSQAPDSDWFTVALDSHHDHLNAYAFSVNPAGVKRDEISNGGFRGDQSWDVVWDGSATVDPQGWSAELRIPFSQLRFSSATVQTWGVQFERRINRLQETSVFVFTPRGERGGVARYGHLTGLTDLKAGKRSEVMPYVVGRGQFLQTTAGDPFRDGSEYGRGIGLDALYRLTTSMTLSATVNPDFGQVEVDPAVINLSAFETSFQENRPFFVEGADLFRFGNAGGGGGGFGMGPGGGGGGGGGGQAPQLLYSRRIGRAPQGSLPSEVLFSNGPETATILGAAKLTGRTASGWSVGLIEAVTGEESSVWLDENGTDGRSIVEPRSNYVVGRVLKSLRSGQTRVGVLGTASHRELDDAGLAALLRSESYTGGVDFSHEFLRRTWSVEAFFSGSHVAGSTDAMIRTQRQSSRYFQRPDADYFEVDSSLTSMGGYSTRVEIGKRAGKHWMGELNAYAVSPGFEINDVGFQTGVDRMGSQLNVTYAQTTPQGWFRNYRINTGPNVAWNYGGDFVGGRVGMGMNGQLRNFWGAGFNFNKRIAGYDDRLTRGGPLVSGRGGQGFGVNVNSDSRRKVTGRFNANVNWGQGEGTGHRIGGNIQVRPVENWTLSFGPQWSQDHTYTQYVTSVDDANATATFGRRYIFTELKQNEISMETRLNVTFRPQLSLELFLQPLISSGDYLALRELKAPRTYEFNEFGKDAGTVAYDAAERVYTVDPDGSGPAGTFTVDDRDFNTQSLRGNAVLRWEYRPGSTLFLVWQQRRSGTMPYGDFDFSRDTRSIFDARADNVFVLKFNYWLNL
jgi:hypothetical protein